MKRRLLSTFTAFCFFASSAHAQNFSNIFSDNIFSDATDVAGDLMDTLIPGVTNVRIGLGPVISPDYVGSNSYDVNVAPLISLRYKDLIQVDNNQIRVNLFGEQGALWQSKNFRAGPTLKIDFGRSAKDSPDLTGLGNIGTSIEVGAFASYATGPLRYRIRARQDVASGHKGMLADVDISLAVYRTQKVSVGARLGTTWASKKYMGKYFGITAAQAAASKLPTYLAGSGLRDINLSVGSEIKLTDRWAVVVNGGAERLLSKTKNSPLVVQRGSPHQLTFGAFGVYSF